MKAGDVVLVRLRVSGGSTKLRPALVLTMLPGPYQNVLLCGITTQLQQLEPQWDELLDMTDEHFAATGLRQTSAVRLSYLYAAKSSTILGVIGRIHAGRCKKLLARLQTHLQHAV